MSHYSRIKTIIKDKATLLQCLSDLGYEVTMYTKSRRADISILIGRRQVNFARNSDSSYDMIADWDFIDKEVQKKFTESLLQRYAVKTIIAQTNQQGFNVIENTQEEDGSIRIVIRRWV